MARVIITPAGPLLTSPMNAHSLTRGDQVVIGKDETGYAVLTVCDNRTMADRGMRWIEFEGSAQARFGSEFGINEPVNRVVGARSGAGGGLL